MSKKHFYVRSINIPIYKGRLIIILTNDSKMLNSHVPEFENVKEEVYAHTFYTSWDESQAFVIALNFKHKVKITHGIIWHEVLHVVNYIANYVGIEHDVNNDEPMAYLGTWITDEVYKFINKQNIKI